MAQKPKLQEYDNMAKKEELNPITMLSIALREIRNLKSTIEDLRNQVANLSAGHTRKVSIAEYMQEKGCSYKCVREHIHKGILNAEQVGKKYYIILPA